MLQLLPQSDTLTLESTNPCEAVAFINSYIEKYHCENMSVDISFLNDIIKNVCSISKDTTVELPEIEDVLGDPQSSTYVPFRNLIFSSLALSFAESNDANLIFLGIQSNDCYGYWDCTQEFTDTLNSLTKLNRKTNIQIVTPFVNFDKKDEIFDIIMSITE